MTLSRKFTLVLALLVAIAVPFVAAQSAPGSNGTAPDAMQIIGPPTGTPLTGDALLQKTHSVASQIRCPVCQGLSIADSPSEMAVNMKQQVNELLARGYTEEQILKYFEKSYGQFVLLDPKKQGVNWLVWIAPIAALLIGGFIVVSKITKLRTAVPAEELPDEVPTRDTLPDDPELAAYVLRVREMAYGWSGGVSPEKGTSS